ncbi:MAG TPA: hypothetical protein VFM05_02415 [Candidatus Saccharimonadales bacterium]|nr:hypothetical protein [Candidatus Saccharimonadales bacterium]
MQSKDQKVDRDDVSIATTSQPSASTRPHKERNKLALGVAIIVVVALVGMGIIAAPKIVELHIPSVKDRDTAALSNLPDTGMASIGYSITDFFKADGSVDEAYVSQFMKDLPYHPSYLKDAMLTKLGSFIDEDAKAGVITTEQATNLKDALKKQLNQ